MSDYFEIDFLDVESDKSGDAIAIRYQLDGVQRIHVVDGGFEATGGSMVQHIQKYYGNPRRIDAVVATHPDGDHTVGLRTVLESFEVGGLWMHRPWLYSQEILHRFKNVTTAAGLIRALREAYPNIVALEEIAKNRGIPIYEAFQGTSIGDFVVLAPSKKLYLDLVVNSDKTPVAVTQGTSILERFAATLVKAAASITTFVKAAWGVEAFPSDDTSEQNNMSVVQYANLCGERILLTADAGRATLSEAADFAPNVGLALPGIDRIQIPHHGSRHNVSTELLDRWLGPRLAAEESRFSSYVSSAEKDKDHPRKSVVRAFMHRGARVIATEGKSICAFRNAPTRGWVPVSPEAYPTEQEE